MKTNSQLLVPFLALLLCAGCVGNGPNTQQGALGGGALGALAGAIIGNNSGHGNALNGALIGGAVGAIAGGTMGNQADHQRGTIYGSEAAATTEVVVDSPPPPPAPQQEVIYERSTPDAVWIQGYWVYRGRGGYAWMPGHWEVPPPSYHRYVAAHWQRRGRGYVYINGYWH
jgi:YMGG-like Gly-zipper/WXXGXW repeat (2 copies)